MEDLYIYTGSIAVLGVLLGGPAVGSLIAGDRSIPILLTAIGGGGMLVTAGYNSLRTDPEEFTVPAIGLLLLVAAVCLTLIGTVLSAVSGV
ncbi:hypothetical protein GWG54_18390 [Natronococcus sp. JC468]|uniref:hypothetical protein n=1 Tax=Natronococcus sp. JC468 TaxID=1961921 RepID=UPI00143B2D00|nr:hypothetical protein [Natronococcus sp. JC468]NKE37737.1 hypothetical protein [Natronococcus sp. JC468]